jgi:glutamine synthetase
MDNDPIPSCRIANFQKGFGDFQLNPDINSYREIDYVNGEKQILLFSDLTQHGSPLEHAPRTLLKNAVTALEGLGLSLEIECGINYTIFEEKFKKNQENLSIIKSITEHCNEYNFLNTQVHDELINKFNKSLKLSGIHVESIYGEKTPGQFRVNLSKKTDLVEFCDNILLLKLVHHS